MSEETTQPTERLLNNKYRIIEMISTEGGFGVIYKVKEIHPHFDPAIRALKKLIPRSEWDNETIEGVKKAFLNEARTLKELDILYVPKVLDFFIEDEFLYLVMDYIEGDNLEKIIKQKEPSLDEAISIVEKLLKTLHSLHTSEQHIIHRDIKPGNIILKGEEVWLVDFGLAKSSELKTILPGACTPSYSPFEQYRQLPTDERSDIYSVGATFYRLLTGKKPADSVARFQKLEIAKSDDPILNITKEFPQIPKLIAEVVYRALALYQEERFATASEMLEALQEANRKTNDADEHLEKAQEYYEQKDWDKAIAEFKRVIELKPNSSSSFFRLGYCYAKKGENNTAIQYYSKAIKLNPNYSNALNNRAICYRIMGDATNEIADLSHAIELSEKTLYRSNRVETYFNLIKKDLHFLMEKSKPESETYKQSKRRLSRLDEIDFPIFIPTFEMILILLLLVAAGIGIAVWQSRYGNITANNNSSVVPTNNTNSQDTTKKVNEPVLIGSPYEITLTPVEVSVSDWKFEPCRNEVVFVSPVDKGKWTKLIVVCKEHFANFLVEIDDYDSRFDNKVLSTSLAKEGNNFQLETQNFKAVFKVMESHVGGDPDSVSTYPEVFKKLMLSVMVQEIQKK